MPYKRRMTDKSRDPVTGQMIAIFDRMRHALRRVVGVARPTLGRLQPSARPDNQTLAISSFSNSRPSPGRRRAARRAGALAPAWPSQPSGACGTERQRLRQAPACGVISRRADDDHHRSRRRLFGSCNPMSRNRVDVQRLQIGDRRLVSSSVSPPPTRRPW